MEREAVCWRGGPRSIGELERSRLNSSLRLSVCTISSSLASPTYTGDFHREKGVFDSSGGAESIIVNGPVSNFTQRVCKASTLYMQSRGALLKELVASDYFCNLISLVTQW